MRGSLEAITLQLSLEMNAGSPDTLTVACVRLRIWLSHAPAPDPQRL